MGKEGRAGAECGRSEASACVQKYLDMTESAFPSDLKATVQPQDLSQDLVASGAASCCSGMQCRGSSPLTSCFVAVLRLTCGGILQPRREAAPGCSRAKDGNQRSDQYPISRRTGSLHEELLGEGTTKPSQPS